MIKMTVDLQKKVALIQGDCLVTDNPNVVYTTILGSCIAVCMFDPIAKVGGMNHFLLPGSDKLGVGDMRYGVNSMELLVNGILKLGAERDNLVCKIFGGGEMRKSFNNVGTKNQTFIKKFLKDEGFSCLVENLGGAMARRLEFLPCTGKVRHMLIPPSETPVETVPDIPGAPPASSIELF